MSKFDSDNSGGLDIKQLGLFLKELNEDLPVPDEEVKWVMDHADVLGDGSITQPELVIAISLWYTRQDEHAHVSGGAGRCGGCSVQ